MSINILIVHVLSDKREVGIEIEILKSSSNHRSQITSIVTRSIARNLASTLEDETATCFLAFQAMSELTRKI
jgi:hypothetical protein